MGNKCIVARVPRNTTLLKTDVLNFLGLKKNKYLLLLLILSGMSFVVPEPVDLDVCTPQNLVFQDGEEIVYKVYYNWNFIWLSAGEVVFKVNDMGDSVHLSATGNTFRSYEWFFKVRDRYDCVVDKESFRPMRSSRKIEEGKYREYDDTEYDFENLKAVSEIGKSMESRETTEIEIGHCVHDILSCLYQVRNLDVRKLENDSRVPLSIYFDKKIYDLDLVYKGAEVQRIKGMGKCNTLLIEPELIVGDVFKDNKGMKVWASDDENRVPLMIESPVSVGSVKVVLKSYQGAKFPFKPSIR